MENVSHPESLPANGGVQPPPQWEDSVVRDICRLILLVEVDTQKIAAKASHLVQSRQNPQDCLRNAEILEDYATRLLTHARQIVRRAMEKQP